MRKEFPAKVKVAAFERAGGHCESCTAKLFPGNTEYDHAIPCALGGDNTLDNCRVVCRACHRTKTSGEDIPRIAKGKRVRARHLGAKAKSPRRFKKWRRFDGTIVHAS